MIYNYTIIIPHKNTPELLQRCLDSIPRRDDTHIIVVDDNSSTELVDFDNFPGKEDENIELVFLKEGKGAGHARNIGLNYVKDSKWIIFADSDDFFSENLNKKLDFYTDFDADLIFFLMDSVDSVTLMKSERKEVRNRKFYQAIKNNNYDLLRYKMYGPTTKFVSYELVRKNNILFDETPAANDAMFSVKIGYYAKKIIADNDILYVATDREGSLVNTPSFQNLISRFEVTMNINSFLQQINKSKYRANIYNHLYELYKYKFIYGLKYNLKYIQKTPIKYITMDTLKAIKYIL